MFHSMNKAIYQSIKADHGFTINSPTLNHLVRFMSELKEKEKRAFLMFMTGSPRLPYGGFLSLNPPLTVVCKSVGKHESPDQYLPSVMTCVNYLKVPNYTTYGVLSERFHKVMVNIASLIIEFNLFYNYKLEGQGSFHLS